ncbi:B12-binding domain-containing radical SAM protein [Paracoccaceae bacterium]|nr:B12-binding domain-containing radical SAM protein [Paracoccaceae bacterium]
MKKILFINPSLRLKSPTKFLPVGIASVMTYLNSHNIDFDFLDVDINELEDSQIEDYLDRNRYDIILSGSIVTHYKWMKWLTNTVKTYNRNSIVIIGNSVAGSIPTLFLENSSADIAILGEGEITCLELVRKIIEDAPWDKLEGLAYKKKNGEVVVNKNRRGLKKLDDFPMINWQAFETEKYFQKSYAAAKAIDDQKVRVMPVVTARGCAFRCTFCHFVFWNDPYRYRSPENILAEIKRNIELYNCNYISFWDDLSFASLPQAERFADAILASGLKFNWSAAVRVDLFGNPKHDYQRRLEVARKFKLSGCQSLGFSLESANSEILVMMNKRIEGQYFLDQVDVLDKVGITSMISVVFGYPIETPDTIAETFNMCLEARIYPSIGYLLPLPATGMYDYAIKNGFITDQNKYLDSITERQDLCLNMTQMGDEEVKNFIAEGAGNLNEKLNIGLNSGKLLKTGGYNKHTSKKKLKKLTREKNSLILNYNEAEFEADLGIA